jgi:hypothetical protein
MKKNITIINTSFITSDKTSLPAVLGYSENSLPTRLVIFCHGHHESMNVFDSYLPLFTDEHTVTLAISYRNDNQFPVMAGAEDIIFAATAMLNLYPSVQHIYLYSASMGGAIAGTAIAESRYYTLPGNRRLAFWVNASGVSNLSELYSEALLFYPDARTELEAETGGTPLNKRQEYVRRSPALRTQDMKAAGLQQVSMIHARHDGIVLYNQAVQLCSALMTDDIPVSLESLVCFSGTGSAGATLYSDVGLPDNVACLLSGCSLSTERVAGHVNTADINNPASDAGIKALRQLLNSTQP